MNFSLPVQVRWSDIDANMHLRHSVYYDWGAFCRIEFFNSHKLSMEAMRQLQIGPVIFKEECVFRKEIKPADTVMIDLTLATAKKDFSRWSIKHRIFKNENILCARLTVEGAWIDLEKRKLVVPPQFAQTVFSAMPRDEDFEWVEPR